MGLFAPFMISPSQSSALDPNHKMEQYIQGWSVQDLSVLAALKNEKSLVRIAQSFDYAEIIFTVLNQSIGNLPQESSSSYF